jgi:biotin transport system substrate-specific component
MTRTKLLKEVGTVIGALLFISLCAQIAFDLPGGIPFSGQSFAILSVAISLGWKRGVVIISLYLLLGASGFPIFAGGASGTRHFVEGSGGYFLGFIAATLVVGWLKNKGCDRTFGKSVLAFLLGHLIILLCGTVGIYMIRDIETAITYGLNPFLFAALLKSILGGLVMPIYYELKESW